MTKSLVEIVGFEIKADTYLDAMSIMRDDDFDPENSDMVEDFRTLHVCSEEDYRRSMKFGNVGTHEHTIIVAKIDEFQRVTGARFTEEQRNTFYYSLLTSYRENGYLPVIVSVPQ